MKICLTEPKELTSLYRNHRELFGLVHVFNLLPANYIHLSWLEDRIPEALLRNYPQSHRSRQKFSQWLLTQNGLVDAYFFDFRHPMFRLALLPYAELKTLTLYCGIALTHRSITTVIDKPTKEMIIESIGRQGYFFAFKEAPLLTGGNTFEEISWPVAGGEFKQAIQHCGTAYLLSVLAHSPEPFFKRLLLKFPRDVAQSAYSVLSNQKGGNAWLFLRRLLKHVIDPQWHPLFI